jgi:hypothetical protein
VVRVCVCKINIVELFKIVCFNAREYNELLHSDLLEQLCMRDNQMQDFQSFHGRLFENV